MTWIDDDEREYTGPYQSVKGGWELLNREERIGFKFFVFVGTLLVLLAGMEAGQYIDPHEPMATQIGQPTYKTISGDVYKNESKATAFVVLASADSSVFCSDAKLIEATISEDEADWSVHDETGLFSVMERVGKNERIRFCVEDTTVGVESIGLVDLGTTTFGELRKELNRKDTVVFDNPTSDYKIVINWVRDEGF